MPLSPPSQPSQWSVIPLEKADRCFWCGSQEHRRDSRPFSCLLSVHTYKDPLSLLSLHRVRVLEGCVHHRPLRRTSGCVHHRPHRCTSGCVHHRPDRRTSGPFQPNPYCSCIPNWHLVSTKQVCVTCFMVSQLPPNLPCPPRTLKSPQLLLLQQSSKPKEKAWLAFLASKPLGSIKSVLSAQES